MELREPRKKLTLAKATPEDFAIIYPKFQTKLEYNIPTKEIDVTGDFSVTYDMREIEKKDVYEYYPYQVYNHSDNAVTHICNELANNNNKLLIVKDSFANVVAPFLSLGVSNCDIIDLRSFDGSLHSYVKKEKPDAIVVIYNVFQLNKEIKYNHHDLYDFS